MTITITLVIVLVTTKGDTMSRMSELHITWTAIAPLIEGHTDAEREFLAEQIKTGGALL